MNFVDKFSGFMLFVSELFVNPLAIGAACPSSKKLADTMVEQIPNLQNGFIVELGGGTGVVTEALLKKGFDKKHIIVIERSTKLYQHLAKRFPDLMIIQGDAIKLSQLIPKNIQPVNAIISSLPLRVLPQRVVTAIEHEVSDLLAPNGHFIQFTYDLRKASKKQIVSQNRLHYLYSKWVGLNLPPARIDVFRKSIQ